MYLYAVPDGVPLYFKHNELTQKSGYQTLWRGNPLTIEEHEAVQLVARLETPTLLYRDYQQAPDATVGFRTATESFRSAVHRLCQQLEYAAGTYPSEVLVGELTT